MNHRYRRIHPIWRALPGVCCLLMVACRSPAALPGEELSQVTPVQRTPSANTQAAEPTVVGEVRPPMYAGSWYPGDPTALASSVDALLNAVDPVDGEPVGLLVPHAGHVFSGPVAAYGFRQIEGVDYDAVVIIGPNHRHPTFSDVSVWAEGGFETPLGIVPVNQEVAAELIAADSRIVFHREVHLEEHSIEIQLPFLQRACPDCTIVPVVFGQPTEENIQALSKALEQVSKHHKILIIASSDLSHYPSYDNAVLVDSATLAAIETGSTNAVSEQIGVLIASGIPNLATCACGEGPLLALMHAVSEMGADYVTVLSYANSGDSPAGSRDQVVGYGTVMFWHWEPHNLTPAAKDLLLDLARQSIAWELGLANEAPDVAALIESDSSLARRAAVFVTLTKNGDLRGCVGQTRALVPLAEAVQQAVLDAAFGDPRFRPLQAHELDDVRIEISVLSPFKRVIDVETDIQVGTHGLVIVTDTTRGLLLPQVAVENGFSREEFLEAVALKAGLPPDAWRHATLYTFMADIFADTD